MKSIEVDDLEPDEVSASIYAAPEDSRWRFSCSKVNWLTLTRLP